ncbi:MAG: pseudouridine synthase [Bacteroidales bacterium]|nr:pseudouridine synthase [Bacteroidales bacterium]
MREFAIFAAQNRYCVMERKFNTEDIEGDYGNEGARPRKNDRSRHDEKRSGKRSFSSRDSKFSRPKRRFKDDDNHEEKGYSGKRSFKGMDRDRDKRRFSKNADNRSRRRNVTAESSILTEIVERRKQEGRQNPRKPQILTLEYEEQHGPIRLNKYIANAGICSRREADVLISSGAITVNGEVVTEMGHKVMPTDEVRYGDKVLQRERPVYVLLNKPKDYITTTDDEHDRANVMELVRDACDERIYPVGRLDRDTTGLLLFTNDGDLTKKLTHPSSQIEKTYMVELDKPFAPVDMEAIRNGVELSDGVIVPDDVQYVEDSESKNVVGVTIHSGKNRIIRRMFDALGYEVVKLDRVVFAGLTKKDLRRGYWRFLTKKEVSFLKMISSKNKEEEK